MISKSPENINKYSGWMTRRVRIHLKVEENSGKSAAQFFALIVGINQYPTLPPLAGCVNDAVGMRDFLQSRVDQQLAGLKITTLLDREATRDNVISNFENIVSETRKNDTVLFYFAGYGSQEPAPEEFRSLEDDQLNETIVLYDSRIGGGMDLADKEIATLLDEIAVKGAHILMISDCSHRDNAYAITAENCRVAPRFPRIRPISSYITPGVFKPEKTQSSYSVSGIVQPDPPHFALTAVSGDEAAQEVFSDGKVMGIMTATLLDILRSSSGNLAYQDLITRLRTRTAQRTSNQVPDLVSVLDMHIPFLNGLIRSEVSGIQLNFDKQKNQWVVNRGTSHGFKGPGIDGEKMILAVYPSGISQSKQPRSPLAEITLETLEPDQSIANAGNASLDPRESYAVQVVSMPVSPVKIHFFGENRDGIEMMRKAFLSSSQAIYLQEVAELQLADYQVFAGKKQFLILRQADRMEKPLLPPTESISYETAVEVIRQINHIARWRQILEIVNPASGLSPEAIRLEIYPGESEVADSAGLLTYPAWEQGVPFRIKLVNTTDKRLYCTLVYMSSSFEINTGLLPNKGQWIEPGEGIWGLEGSPLRAVVSENLTQQGIREAQEIFKLIFAEEDFSAEGLNQISIQEPQPITRSLLETSTRNLLFSGRSAYSDWNTFEIPLTIRIEEDTPGAEYSSS
ncbi:MAG: caspase family protein [Bacteroidia bacterium]